jgi:FKBP-type peptidyl-prolyl cis-trans isomerase FkpA
MMMRVSKTGCLAVLTIVLGNGCSTPPPDSDSAAVPTAPAVSTTSAQSEPGSVDPDASEDFTSTPSGLRYRIRRQGSGASPTSTDRVLCHYRGWLDDGKEFDSSYKRGEPIDFPLNGVIPGWTEGLQLVKEGGMIELEIPSELGYGEQGFPPDIPPGATLHFTVELIEVL